MYERPQTYPLMINLLQLSKRSESFEAYLLAIAGLEVQAVLEYVHEVGLGSRGLGHRLDRLFSEYNMSLITQCILTEICP